LTSNISRNNILNALSEAGVPLALAEILVALGASGEASGTLALEHLGALIERGSVVRTRRNRYALSERMDMVSGRVTGHRDGYGFVERTGSAPDLYLAPREMRRVLHGDKVLARVKRIDNRGRHEGVVVSLVERGTRTMVGRFVQDRGVGYVVPDDSRFSQDVTVFPEDQGDALDGHIVVVEIVGHPFDSRHLKGRVIECLGDHLAPGMESEIAIRKHGIPWEWPDGLDAELAAAGFDESGIRPDSSRVDLRELPLVTIDGADAKDFDDAVAASRKDGGWTLWVAIADVSHYVKPGDMLDRVALERGNSVYFPGRVIPMLPEVLSNGLCSLKPEVDRYSLSCRMRIAADGEVTGYEFHQGLIR
jgi:ribonuclease R